MKKIILILFVVISFVAKSQEINAVVRVVSTKDNISNKNIYKSLEKALYSLVNKTKWTDIKYNSSQKIEAVYTIVINKKLSSNKFDATLEIQSVRPVFESSYKTDIVNIKDNNFEFEYNISEPLRFNKNVFDNNLVQTIAYYTYMILGYDGDSFSKMGGQQYFEKAQKIVNNATNSKYKGWDKYDGGTSRYNLVYKLLSDDYSGLRNLMYDYHINGLDRMHKNINKAKKNINNAIVKLENFDGIRTNAYPLQIFMLAKSDEIVDIFSKDKKSNFDISNLKSVLTDLHPAYSEKWDKLVN